MKLHICVIFVSNTYSYNEGRDAITFGKRLLTKTWNNFSLLESSDLTILPYKTFHFTNDVLLSNVFNEDKTVSIGESKGNNVQALEVLMNLDTSNATATTVASPSAQSVDSSKFHNNYIYNFEFHDYFTATRKIEEYSLMSYVMIWKCWDVVKVYERRDYYHM